MAAIVGTSTRGWNGANDTTVASAAKNTTTGNLIAVCVTTQESASTTIDSVADTAGNTYVAGTHYGAGGAGALARWFYAYNITGNASNVVTATMSGNTRYKGIHQIEISGLDTTSAVLSGQSGGIAFSSATISPGNITLSAAGIFLYGVVSTNDRSFTPDGAYTEIDDAQGGAWGGSGSTAYDIDAGSTDNPTATASSASDLTIAAIAFLDASGGGQPPRSMHQYRLRRAS